MLEATWGIYSLCVCVECTQIEVDRADTSTRTYESGSITTRSGLRYVFLCDDLSAGGIIQYDKIAINVSVLLTVPIAQALDTLVIKRYPKRTRDTFYFRNALRIQSAAS